MTCELHCHSIFSVDGYKTPEELVDLAVAEDITTLSITDHNHLGGQERAIAYAEQRSLAYIPGVEMDCLWEGELYHFLCYGFDSDHPELARIARANSKVAVRDFEIHWKLVEAQRPGVSYDELRKCLPERYPTHPSPALNRWLAQDVCLEKGIFASGTEFQEFWESIVRENEENDEAETVPPFASFGAVRDAAHGAGGVILLAHVGHYVGPRIAGDLDAQLDTIHRFLLDGCDGFELYHPALMTEPYFDELVHEAGRLGCVVSGGSDRHTGVRGVAPGWVVERLQAKLVEAYELRGSKRLPVEP